MDASDDNDPLEGLEERLKSHNRAFESLLALTPARDYYGSHVVDGSDPSEQWNRKKQTREQRRAAKKAKLDPANQKSALDIMKEREAEVLKRKRDDDGEPDDLVEGASGGKRQKSEEDADASEARRREKVEKKKEYRVRKKERKEAKKAKIEAKKAKRQEKAGAASQAAPLSNGVSADDDGDEGEEEEEKEAEAAEIDPEDAMESVDITGLNETEDFETIQQGVTNEEDTASSAPSTPNIESPAFDVATNHSAASSSSSIVPPSLTDKQQQLPRPETQSKPKIDTSVRDSVRVELPAKPKDVPSGISSPKIQLPNIDHSILQERLRQRIEELRAARKADGPDGKPAKSRQELLEQRRKKEEQRKATKKEQIRKTKEDERQRQEERLRGSGSPLSAEIFSPHSPHSRDNSFSFSRLAFEDGTTADPSLTELSDPKRKKGPQDPKTALQAAQSKQSRIAGYDADKQANIAEKDMWLNASKRAHGERVRDDTSLLKKALKRKEKQKGKSEQQWKEREQAVVKGREMKQKKRETNLQKRKEEKGNKGKKKGPKTGKPKARPGFEGRFKA